MARTAGRLGGREARRREEGAGSARFPGIV